MLIEQRAVDRFHPEQYEDEVKKRIQGQLQKKIETGQEISSSPKPKTGEVIDLMEALRRSLAASPSEGRRKSAPAAAESRKPPKKAARAAEKPEKKAARR